MVQLEEIFEDPC